MPCRMHIKKDTNNRSCLIFSIDLLDDSYNTLQTDMLSIVDTAIDNAIPTLPFLDQQQLGGEISSSLLETLRQYYYVFARDSKLFAEKDDGSKMKSAETSSHTTRIVIPQSTQIKAYDSVIFGVEQYLEQTTPDKADEQKTQT